jgi:hypothetical protein
LLGRTWTLKGAAAASRQNLGLGCDLRFHAAPFQQNLTGQDRLGMQSEGLDLGCDCALRDAGGVHVCGQPLAGVRKSASARESGDFRRRRMNVRFGVLARGGRLRVTRNDDFGKQQRPIPIRGVGADRPDKNNCGTCRDATKHRDASKSVR